MSTTISTEEARMPFDLLIAAGYVSQSCYELPGSIIEFWNGPKGVVIVQLHNDDSGASMFADWPLGTTWEQVEAALKS